MKNSLILENNEILREILSLSESVKEKSQKDTLNKCLSNFRNLTKEWEKFVHTSETALKTTEVEKNKAISLISKYKKITRVNSQKLKKISIEEKKNLIKENQVASQLSIFPKLWKKNLNKLRKKSMSWRVTPFVQPQYDQEFTFLNSTKEIIKEKNNEESQNYSMEFDKLMKEIEATKTEECYDNDKISIDKTFGGWKSEFESEGDSHSRIYDSSEIRNAISILYRANLLKPESRPILSKITQIVKKPGNSANLALFLQLFKLNNSNIPSFFDKPSENDVKMADLLEATSFLSSLGPKMMEESLLDISCDESYLSRLRESHKKTQSLGKNSTKDMTEKIA